MKREKALNLVIGQEIICPYGLGRVAEIVEGVCDSVSVRVDTYINNRSSVYDCYNVRLPKTGKGKKYE